MVDGPAYSAGTTLHMPAPHHYSAGVKPLHRDGNIILVMIAAHIMDFNLDILRPVFAIPDR
jgi:hypothetical protein